MKARGRVYKVAIGGSNLRLESIAQCFLGVFLCVFFWFFEMYYSYAYKRYVWL